MTRPALVIGLGGTGQWITTFLKKELIEIGGGEFPSGVKLLCFDTVSEALAQTGVDMDGDETDDVHVGAVRLERDIEYIPIGANLHALALEIEANGHPHLKWYPAANFLAKLPQAAFLAQYGAGAIRHMGRLALFRDVSAVATSKLLASMRQALEELKAAVSRDNQLEVIIVGSLAGGTGGGCWLILHSFFAPRRRIMLGTISCCVACLFFRAPSLVGVWGNRQHRRCLRVRLLPGVNSTVL